MHINNTEDNIRSAGIAMGDAARNAADAVERIGALLKAVDVKGPDDHVADAIFWLKSLPIEEFAVYAAVRDTAVRDLEMALYKFDNPDL